MGDVSSIGDAVYKWSIDIQERLHEEYLGDYPRPNVKTPPYFTVEPEVTMTEVKPGDFLIMA
jgi:pyruvate dehydrogenase phosphatase